MKQLPKNTIFEYRPPAAKGDASPLEPVFMILGQSAGTAAALAIDANVAVQDVDYSKLRKHLRADNQRLAYPKKK